MMRLLTTAIFLLALGSAGQVSAQSGSSDLVGSLTEEETSKVVRFGRGVGQAYTCAKPEDRPEMLEDIRMIFNFMNQDMGTDAAFVYAALVGYGSSEAGGTFDCSERLKQWAEILDQFGLSEVGS